MPMITQKTKRKVRVENYETDTFHYIEIPMGPNTRPDQRLLESIIAITVTESQHIQSDTMGCLRVYLETALMEDQFMGVTIGSTHIMIENPEGDRF